MECGICGSNSHNTLDHKESREPCRHDVRFGNKCLLCGFIIKDKDKEKKE